jgi:CheY-like chemotaxis protein
MNLPKIIWIDDEIENLQSQTFFLEKKGYEITTFTNSFDALEFLKHNLADVILLDESMPGMTGLQTLEKIKAQNTLCLHQQNLCHLRSFATAPVRHTQLTAM